MPSESDLRDLLRGPDPEGRTAIDLDAVLTRARRRRRPRVIAAQALGSVALVGVLVTAVTVSLPRAAETTAITAQDTDAGAGEAEAAPFADDSHLRWMPDSCGAPASDPVSADGLSLELAPLVVEEGTSTVPVTVTLRNERSVRVAGVTDVTPHLTLSRDGLVVWHSAVAEPATPGAARPVVDLEPGESMTFDATLDLVICGSEEDILSDAPMPLATAGAYELRAVLVIDSANDPAVELDRVGGGPAPVEIR